MAFTHACPEQHCRLVRMIFRSLSRGDSENNILNELQMPGMVFASHDLQQLGALPELSYFRDFVVKKEKEILLRAAVQLWSLHYA